MRHWFPVIVLLTLSAAANAVEEPDYAVIRKWGAVEVRFYAPYVVAQVVVAGPEDIAGNQGFPILADYIFGKNKGEKQLAAATPARFAMTAPVTQTAASSGFLVQFVLPKHITLESAPEPVDDRVQLRAVAESKRATIAFSGFWSAANYNEHLEKLQSALRAVNLPWTGEPVYARYNPPWTPWFMRRNEIWLAVQ